MNFSIKKASIEYTSPSNIAFVKYWGKRSGQIPENPSLSMTLSECYTSMKINFTKAKRFQVKSFLFEKRENDQFKEKIYKKLILLLDMNELDYLNDYELDIESFNSFPHSSGIASSASSFSALILCLVRMESKLLQREFDLERVSFLSRLCSGSASRSIYPRFSHWGESSIKGSSNLFARAIDFKEVELCDSILVVSSHEKSVSSSMGHELMSLNPYKRTRYKNALDNFDKINNALIAKDFSSFGKILEQEAMELHALMLCSSPSVFLLEPHSLTLIDKVKDFRIKTGLPLYYTIDAGPNIHLIYPDSIKGEVLDFIKKDLLVYVQKVIHDKVGSGPKLIKEFYE